MARTSRVAMFVPLSILMALAISNGLFWEVSAAGECGRTPVRSAAASLSPCLGAARDARAKVPPACCAKVNALIRTAPRCLCAVLLSPMAKQAGIMPGTAISIPKRCNIRNRPAGKKCGRYTVP
ncbi:non-specific lipid-transfer protein-like [Rhodamnia argentea]|uniref:Non-specific lipid-transfer protein-like n=1 Tax=Rhodamnia argentea TaxID=178133 RepID=A0A8B8P3Z0_9MYRT|nr:non-specific lipid-transfer protein-like [Rhodamnia argentea]XP_030529310.1 non-specific lipid-transfer protein-like [Rhodamnia argentea]